MKILLISGFLGAGKTTFIQEMIKKTGRQFAIMENEYGEIGIDGKLLGEGDDSSAMNIYELTEGCICCSVKADFANSILTIANALNPEFLIVEPTGVGKLSAIIDNIKKITYEKIQLLQPVTLVDIHDIDRNIQEFPDIYVNQIQHSQRIILSKCEGAPQADRQIAKETLLRLSPHAIIETDHYSRFDKSYFESMLKDYLTKVASPQEEDYEESTLDNIGLSDIYLDDENKLFPFLNGIVSGIFGDIVRAKGYLQCRKAYLRFDVVGKNYSITSIDNMTDSRAVFIGKNLKAKWLIDYLMQKNTKTLRPLL